MSVLERYLTNILDIPINVHPIPKEDLKGLSIYIKDTYNLYETNLLNHSILLAEPRQQGDIRALQVEKHFTTLQNVFLKTCVLLLHELPAYLRKRLIEKRINFIIPGKQVYLPDLLIDLRDEQKTYKVKPGKVQLSPASQFIILYHLLHRDDLTKIENQPLLEVADFTGYTQATISQATAELVHHQLIEVEGTKEKTIHFKWMPKELWQKCLDENRLTTPLLNRVFLDAKPENTNLLRANISAMADYTDLNPDYQEYFAIGKKAFYRLEKENKLPVANPVEGKYCLEVWKYNPFRLATAVQVQKGIVDPLSLYLSMQDQKDERVEMALDQLLNEFSW